MEDSSRKPRFPKKITDIKNIVLSHLVKYKSELKDEDKTAFKPMTVPLPSIEDQHIALEVVSDDDAGDNPETVRRQREKINSVVEQLVQDVKSEGNRILVVNVNTPAVDMAKSFNPEQLNFMKNDIFSKIQDQLGTDFTEDIEDQWDIAYNAMLDIVKREKKQDY